MWWTSSSSALINVLQLSKYLSESSKTLYIESLQLAITKFCLSIKDCRSQPSFNDFTIKGLGKKILALEPKFLDYYEKSCFSFSFQDYN